MTAATIFVGAGRRRGFPAGAECGRPFFAGLFALFFAPLFDFGAPFLPTVFETLAVALFGAFFTAFLTVLFALFFADITTSKLATDGFACRPTWQRSGFSARGAKPSLKSAITVGTSNPPYRSSMK